MPEDNKKDDKKFSFIQEQITSKKKSKLKRMLFSVGWTVVLAGIFGFVGACVFCISEPAISKLLGKQQDRKTVDLTESAGDETGAGTPSSTVTAAPEGNTVDESSDTGEKSGSQTNDETKDSETKPIQLKPAPVNVEENANLQDFLNIYTDIRTLAGEVGHSIVKVTSISSGVDWFDNEYEAAKTTSGLIVANNGADLLVLVSYDRIKNAKTIKVAFSGRYDIKAGIQAYDKDLNLAVVTVSLEDIPKSCLEEVRMASLSESYSMIVGTPVLALGAPNGYVGSMEIGMITSYGSSAVITDNQVDLFNTDITYNENGDGYIVNMDGKIIGVITHGLKDDMNQKISTVMCVAGIREIIENLVNDTGQVYFGIKAVNMPEEALKEAQIVNGIYINEVEADSPALTAGLQSGDIIVEVNDTPVTSVSSFHDLLCLYNVKDTITVTVHRAVKDTYKDSKINVVLSKKAG